MAHDAPALHLGSIPEIKVALLVEGMTDLRYIVPFSRALARALPVRQDIVYVTSCQKYNGLGLQRNLRRFFEIVKEHCSHARVVEFDGSSYDVVISVEVPPFRPQGKWIAIQHGFDHLDHQVGISHEMSSYVCSSAITAVKNFPSVVPPYPVSLWDAERSHNHVTKEIDVLFFYPDQLDATHANDLLERLRNEGLRVCIKQRRKWQTVRFDGFPVVYDDVWYPPESISLALCSCAVIGFGSSAYTDLTELGVRYINVDLHPDQRPWSLFTHPKGLNYLRCHTLDDCTISQIITACKEPRSWIPPEDEQIDAFIVRLFDGLCLDLRQERVQSTSG